MDVFDELQPLNTVIIKEKNAKNSEKIAVLQNGQ